MDAARDAIATTEQSRKTTENFKLDSINDGKGENEESIGQTIQSNNESESTAIANKESGKQVLQQDGVSGAYDAVANLPMEFYHYYYGSNTDMGNLIEVEQFDGKRNFTLWQRRVKDILVQQGLAKPLKGKDAQPEKISDEDWEELEARCFSTIRLCIADNTINNVNDVDSAPELWEKLEKLYLRKGLQTKLNLKQDLYKLKMGEGESLMEDMNMFNELIDQLAKVDVNIEEEDQALLLLTSLQSCMDTLKMEEVESTLLSHEKRRKADDSQRSVFVAHG
ncbi:hypothetical protein ACLB2K_041931 [Fragaria x ananassa]